MPSISVRVEGRKSGGTTGDRNHNERIGKQPKYVDESKSDLNSILMPMPTANAIKNECHNRRISAYESDPNREQKRAPKTMRKDAVISVSGIITFSHDAQPIIEQLNRDEQDARFMQAIELAAQKLGTDIAGASVHRDESAIHAHFSLYGYNAQGEPISRRLQKQMLSDLQDEVAQAFSDLGITRGKRIGERIKEGEPLSKTIHRTVRELHRDLPEELEQAKAQLAEQQAKLQKNADLAAKAQAKLEATASDKAAEIAKLEKRIKTYEGRADKAQAEIEQIEGKLTAIKGNSEQIGTKFDIFKTKVKAKTETVKIKTGITSTEEREVFDGKALEPLLDKAYQAGQQNSFAGYNEELEQENARLQQQLATIQAHHDVEIQRLRTEHTQALEKVQNELRERISSLQGQIKEQTSITTEQDLEIQHLNAHIERLAEELVEVIDYGRDYEQKARGHSAYFDQKIEDLGLEDDTSTHSLDR